MKKLLFLFAILFSLTASAQQKKKPTPKPTAKQFVAVMDSIEKKRLQYKRRSDSAYRKDAAKIKLKKPY
jgi:outer membrane lipoprotein-sorting protein